ncbi:MAG: hypothetical protein EBX56_11495, partial [Betaproteobacteria bacterium]|nr:hypothetical protein [Betaproteobacteria bacterium]
MHIMPVSSFFQRRLPPVSMSAFMKRWPTQSSVLALLLAAILGALVSWLGFAIWFAWGDGQHQLLPAYLHH